MTRWVFQIRRLDSLPWPPGLGKGANPKHPYWQLREQLEEHLGADRYHRPAVHQQAFLSGDPEYRRIFMDAVTQLAWSADLPESVDTATDFARTTTLLNTPLPDTSAWSDWSRQVCEHHGAGLWLRDGFTYSGSQIDNGRHRITYLRYHRPPEHEVLVVGRR